MSMSGLFYFFEEGSFAVGDLGCVNLSGCGVPAEKLNPQDWNKETVVMVRWPTKKGSQLYPAKIVKISDDEQSLTKLRERLIKGCESEEECGRGKRKRKPLRITSSDEEPEETEVKKKKTEKRPNLLSKLLEKRKEQLTESTSAQKCTQCCALKEKIQQLEEDNRRLVHRLDTINELKSIVCEIKEGLEEKLPSSKPQKPVLAPPQSTQPNLKSSCEDEMIIGDGVKVNKVKLLRCNHQHPTKLVCDLLGVLFTREELSTHSLTGQKGSASENVKPSLDKTLVNAIFDYTLKKFPSANIKELKGVARNKLNNESKLFKRGFYRFLDKD